MSKSSSRNSVFVCGILEIAIIVLILLFQFAASSVSPRFIDFTPLRWRLLQGCRLGAAPDALNGWNSAVGTYNMPASALSHGVRCSTETFKLLSPSVSLEYSGMERARALVSLHNAGGQVLTSSSFAIPGDFNTKLYWRRLLLKVDSKHVGEPVTLSIAGVEDYSADKWFALRSRADFFQQTSVALTFHILLKEKGISIALCFALALLIVVWIKQNIIESRISWRRYVLFLLFLGAGVHYRSNLFFYKNDWLLLKEFITNGWVSILKPHQGHLSPLLYFWNYLQILSFGAKYSLYAFVSIVFLVINSILLAWLLQRLAKNQPRAEAAARLMGVLYLLNSVHVESVQWFSMQSTLLYLAVVLAILAGSIDGIRSSRGSQRLLFALMLAAVPLIYFGGFSSSITAKPHFTLPDLSRYALVGSQMGAVLRGFGLYPSLNVNSAPGLIASLGSWFPFISPVKEPEMFFAWCGLGLSVIFLIAYLFKEDSGRKICFWVMGQSLVFCAILIPAFTYGDLGTRLSLSLSYHTASLVGVSFMLFPLVMGLLPSQEASSSLSESYPNDVRLPRVFLPLMCFYLCIQLFMGIHYHYFTNRGVKIQLAVSQLDNWMQKLQSYSKEQQIPFAGTGTPLEGLAPKYPKSLAAAIGPEELYSLMKRLEGSPK